MLFTPVSNMRNKVFAPAGPNLLLDLDFTAPAQQEFSASAPIPGVTFDEIYLCDESSGNLVGEIASTPLAASGSPSYDHKAVGFYNGTDAYSKKCVGIDAASGDSFRAATNAVFDFTTGSWIQLVVFRALATPSGSKDIVNKQGSNTGWILRMESNGSLKLYAGDGAYTTATHAGNYDSGAWHAALLVCDRTSNILGVYSGDGTSTTASIAGLGSITSTSIARIGGSGSSAAGVQVAYWAIASGAQCDGISATAAAKVAAFWQHGKSATTPALTYARASAMASEVGYESGFGVRVTKWHTGQMPFAYASAFSHTNKLGGLFEDTTTNLCIRTEAFDNASWTKTNVTVTPDNAEAPDGTYTADLLTATADNGTVQSATMTVTSTSRYTSSVYLKRSGGSDVTGRIIIYNVSGAAEETAVAFTATSEWQRFSVTDSSAASTSQAIRIEIDTNGEAVLAWGAQHELGFLTSYVMATTVAATRAAMTCTLANAGGNTYFKSDAGEVQAVICWSDDLSADTKSRYFFSAHAASGNADLLAFRINDTRRPQFLIYDSSAVLTQNAVLVSTALIDTEYTYRGRWDSATAIDGYSENADIIWNGTRQAGSAATWTAGVNAVELNIGTHTSSTLATKGVLATLKVWDIPRADVP